MSLCQKIYLMIFGPFFILAALLAFGAACWVVFIVRWLWGLEKIKPYREGATQKRK
jgi:hypothetical protein